MRGGETLTIVGRTTHPWSGSTQAGQGGVCRGPAAVNDALAGAAAAPGLSGLGSQCCVADDTPTDSGEDRETENEAFQHDWIS